MNCRKVRRYLFGYFKQELSPEETEKIKAHLESCPECAKEAREIERIDLLLKDDLETFVPSANFNKKLLAKIQTLSSDAEVSHERSWWQKLLHEVFPSIKLRWALVGAVSTIILAWVVVSTKKPDHIQPEFLSQNDSEVESQIPLGSEDITDSAYQDFLKQLVKTSTLKDRRAFVIDNFSFSASGGEDGRIRPENLHKKFVIEKRSYLPARRRTGNHYVLPVVSSQPASQKKDY
ncbi:MAG: zf-HC2 domain-containing protein [candidate division Zixibacteria bacterium]|nr:zf-HC2 domain-containing protein [candidate division Zixibacteria bacterium]